MRIGYHLVTLSLVFSLLPAGAAAQAVKASDAGELPAKIRRFSPTVLTANLALLSPKDRQALQKIIAAAKLLDPLFLRQVWSGDRKSVV